MGMFSPYALAGGFDADDLATQLLRKKLEERQAAINLQDARTEQDAYRMIGEQFLKAGLPVPRQVPQSPAPGQPSQPMQQPATPPAAAASGGSGGGMPAPGAAPPPPNAMPRPQSAAPLPPDLPPEQPAALPPQMQPAAFRWGQVLTGLRQMTGADPKTVAKAVELLTPQIDKETDRDTKVELARQANDEKHFRTIATLQWRYEHEQDATERARIGADIKREVAQIGAASRENVAGINAAAGIERAGINQGGATYRAELGANTKEHIAQITTDLKRELGTRAQDLKEKDLENTMAYRTRVLDLRDKGMDLQNAQAQAKLDMQETLQSMRGQVQRDTLASRERVAQLGNQLKLDLGNRSLDLKHEQIVNTKAYQDRKNELVAQGLDARAAEAQAKRDMTFALANMRDETTRRGQDMVSQDKALALQNKLDINRGKAAVGTDDAVARLTDFQNSIQTVLDHPGFDQATGTLAGAVPSVRQDSVNFDAALDSLRSEKLLAVTQALRAAAGSAGGTGFGRITNFEAQQFQNSMGSLKGRQSPEQLRENLLKLYNLSSQSKQRILNGYEKQYGPQKAQGSGGGVPTPQPGAAEIDTPGEAAREPDGTVFEMGGKRYQKKGAKSVEVK